MADTATTCPVMESKASSDPIAGSLELGVVGEYGPGGGPLSASVHVSDLNRNVANVGIGAGMGEQSIGFTPGTGREHPSFQGGD